MSWPGEMEVDRERGLATSDAVFTGADIPIIKTPGTSVAGQRHRNVSGLVSDRCPTMAERR